MFYFLPPKNPNVIIFQSSQSVEEKRKSVSNKGLTPTPHSTRSYSFSGGPPPTNLGKSSQVRFGALPISFTPPASFEDILDDGYETVQSKQKMSNGIGEKVLAAKKVQSTTDEPTKKKVAFAATEPDQIVVTAPPQQQQQQDATTTTSNEATIVKPPDEKAASNIFAIQVITVPEEVSIIASGLTAELKPTPVSPSKPASSQPTSPQPQQDTSEFATTQQQAWNVRVFVPHRKGGVHKVNISLTSATLTGSDLIKMSLELYKQQTGLDPLYDDPKAFLLRVSEDDGLPNNDWPVLDKKVAIRELSVDQVVLVYDKKYKQEKPVNAKQQQSKYDTNLHFLGDIRLEVYLPSSQLPKIVPLSPDILVKDVLKVLCTKFDLDPRFHDVMTLSGSGGDLQLRAVPKALKEKTLRTANMDKIAVIRTVEEDPADLKGRAEKLTQASNRQSVVWAPLELDTSAEFLVTKTNRYGQRQERILEITPDRIYNKLTKENATGFFGKRWARSTKHPMRSLEDLLSVNLVPDNAKGFTLEFTDEVLKFEAKTQVEAMEIYKKLSTYLQLKIQQKSAAMAKRKSVML